jgi:hypothetical protein
MFYEKALPPAIARARAIEFDLSPLYSVGRAFFPGNGFLPNRTGEAIA